MTSGQRAVLVACGSNWDAPARLPAVLAQAGCHVAVLCDPESALYHTRHVHERHAAPPSLGAYVDALGAHLASRPRPYDWVIAADDPLLDALVVQKPSWFARSFPIDPESSALRLMAGKVGFCEAAAAASLPVPASLICRTELYAQHAAAQLGYPVIVKRDVSFGGLGVLAVEDAPSLARAVATLAEGRPFVLQELVSGRLGNSVALFGHGRPLAWMSAYKARTWPGPFGPSSARAFVEPGEIEGILARLGGASGYHGFGAIDWIERPDGRVVILELNARPVPAIQMGPLVGVDFARAVRVFLDGKGPVQRPAVKAALADRVIPMFPQDLYRAITERDEAALTAWASGAARFDDVPWDDAPLLEHHLRRRSVRRHFERVFGGITRSAP